MPSVEMFLKALWYASSFIVAVVVLDQNTGLSRAVTPYMGPLHAYNRASSYKPPPSEPVHVQVDLPPKAFESSFMTAMNWSPDMDGLPGFNTSDMSQLIGIKKANVSGVIIEIFVTANRSLPLYFSSHKSSPEDSSLPLFRHQPLWYHIPTAYDLTEYLLRFFAECILRGNFIISICHITTTLPPIAAAMLLLGLRRHLDFRGLPISAPTNSSIEIHSLREEARRLRQRVDNLVGETSDARQEFQIAREEAKTAKKREAVTTANSKESIRKAELESKTSQEEASQAKRSEADAATRAKESIRKAEDESRRSKEAAKKHKQEAQELRQTNNNLVQENSWLLATTEQAKANEAAAKEKAERKYKVQLEYYQKALNERDERIEVEDDENRRLQKEVRDLGAAEWVDDEVEDGNMLSYTLEKMRAKNLEKVLTAMTVERDTLAKKVKKTKQAAKKTRELLASANAQLAHLSTLDNSSEPTIEGVAPASDTASVANPIVHPRQRLRLTQPRRPSQTPDISSTPATDESTSSATTAVHSAPTSVLDNATQPGMQEGSSSATAPRNATANKPYRGIGWHIFTAGQRNPPASAPRTSATPTSAPEQPSAPPPNAPRGPRFTPQGPQHHQQGSVANMFASGGRREGSRGGRGGQGARRGYGRIPGIGGDIPTAPAAMRQRRPDTFGGPISQFSEDFMRQ